MNQAPKTIEEAQALPKAPISLTFPTGDLSLMPVDWDDIAVFVDTDGTPREVAFIGGKWCKKELWL